MSRHDECSPVDEDWVMLPLVDSDERGSTVVTKETVDIVDSVLEDNSPEDDAPHLVTDEVVVPDVVPDVVLDVVPDVVPAEVVDTRPLGRGLRDKTQSGGSLLERNNWSKCNVKFKI
ncbi:unnamed protein product [Cochlearia groenlandica]